MDNCKKVQELIDYHAIKAQQSAYDRDTCILAILKVRETLMTIPNDLDESTYTELVLQKLAELLSTYYDPDGMYTSGRSVIGSLRDDIHAAIGRGYEY